MRNTICILADTGRSMLWRINVVGSYVQKTRAKKMRFFYITPYLSDEHLRRYVTEGNMNYDEIIYPSIEKVPL